MKYAERVEFSNIQQYEVGDEQIENLVLKAVRAGGNTVVVGPSAVPVVNSLLNQEDQIKVDCALSYPSGAYFTSQKVEEVKDMLNEPLHIDEFYIVMQVGMYLSGHKDEMREELKALVEAADGIPVKIVTEISVFDHSQMKEICDAAAEAGVSAMVVSADFRPYDIPEPTIEQVREFVKLAAGRFEVIGAGNVTEPKRFLDMLEAGVTRVNTPVGFEILTKLNMEA
ncbi:hypothetical protein ACTNCH_08650 [Candidatus Merdisoma sp. HCP28S3_D10]|uniref:hypothetical protein n=1 Tax=unclassified Candidatus Merdisoma TaxID=3099611 RepID=UPI003F89AF05